jgi:hypothetical protein
MPLLATAISRNQRRMGVNAQALNMVTKKEIIISMIKS